MKKQRKLFCEISPLTYAISEKKCILVRKMKNLLTARHFAKTKSEEPLPFCIYKHNSLIRRRLGNVDMQLQENKAVNLGIAAPKLNKILIRPGETFSFWHLVGNTTEKAGYKAGLTIEKNHTAQGIGGGMCQMTNLIHWMVLHSDLDIVEHHHHDRFDLFPDFKRVIPFGTGTSIMYNYLDYRFKNNTKRTYQLIIYTTDEYLCGELRANHRQRYKYRIVAENEFFSRENGEVFRNGEVYRIRIDRRTGKQVDKTLIRRNHAKPCYDTSGLEIVDLDGAPAAENSGGNAE
ncbi:MAG: VanW family protein [Oscillospiraceae bacterium]|nr:VanW family protein [Oscillospiraceae bacterium]MCR5305249.1 VanW family protein [Oscillospiraceae bacterium]